MNIKYPQAQFEFFPLAQTGGYAEARSGLPFFRLTLTLEKIISLGIILLMAVVFVFAWGVERGKRVTLKAVPQKISAAVPHLQKRPSPIPSVSKPGLTVPLIAGTQPSPEAVVPVSKPKAMVSTPTAAVSKDVISGFTVQVASFKKREHADREAALLKQKGYPSHVVSKGDHLIVCIGSFSKSGPANQLMSKLKKKYKDCLIRRL